MNLPNRSYYPLQEAAKRLGNCNVRDIIHYGATGALNIHVFINSYSAPDNGLHHINIPSDEIEKIDEFGCLSGDGWSIHGLQFKEECEGVPITGYYAENIHGFYHIHGSDLTALEFSEDLPLKLFFLSTSPNEVGDIPVEVSFIGYHLDLKREFLCVSEVDINDFTKSTTNEQPETDKTIAKKAQLIPALLKMVPELNDIDFDRMPVSKIVNIINSLASKKGVDLPETHVQTWAKYLGRK